MATGVVMLVNSGQRISEDCLNVLRKRFLMELGLTNDDFYSDGPLRIASSTEFEIIPKEGINSWLNVNLHKSYFDKSYMRGDIELFIKCAEWLEKELQGCEIIYGHDVSPESFVVFDDSTRQRFHRLFTDKNRMKN